MTIRILNTLLFFWVYVAAFGQSIPYDVVKTIDDCAKEWRQVDGFTAEVVMKHRDPKDTRDFQVWLETPKGRQEIKVKKDGRFRLPAVRANEQGKAQVVHSLEKGALDLSFDFGFSDLTAPSMPEASGTNLFEYCSFLANKFRSMNHLFLRLDDVLPGFKDVQVAIVGVSFPRDVPCSGLAVLKKDDKTVASIDLSQTGKISWMFADYDPRTHRIAFEIKDGTPGPKVSMEMRNEKEPFESKGAIWLRK